MSVVQYQKSQQENNGCAALHVACQFGHKDLVHVLKAAGASLTQKNKFGDVPKDTAGRFGRTELLELL